MSVHQPPRYAESYYEAPPSYLQRDYHQSEYGPPPVMYKQMGAGYGDPYQEMPPMSYHRNGNGRGAASPRHDSGGYQGEYYPPSGFVAHGSARNNNGRMMDMRGPAMQQRVRTSAQYLPAEVIQGLEAISLHPSSKTGGRKRHMPTPARDFEGIRAMGLSPTNKPYHDPRRDRKSTGDGSDAAYRLTWSQTRRIQNLNRPMIPVSIKIPLHDKHLWWESPTVTLNMFAPYSNALVNGEKTIETRNYQLPNKCKGVRIGIVEIMPKNLPSKKPELIGEVVFVDCKEYTSKEEWEKDAPYHKVDPKDERFGWKKNKKKFGWVVHTWQAYDRAIREAASEYCNTRVHYTKNFFVWAYV